MHAFYSNSNKEAISELGKFSLSPMTESWLAYVRGNPGGQYPNILKDF